MKNGGFEPFCKRHQDGMYRVAYQVTHDVEDAEDAVQNAFIGILKVFNHIDFECEKQEKLYALRASKNAALDIARKHVLDIPIEDIEVLTADTTYGDVVAHETNHCVQLCIERLSHKAQTIIAYREMGLCDADIAETLGITVNDVRVTVYRAREKVAQMLQEEGLLYG